MSEGFKPEFKPTHHAAVCIIEAFADSEYHNTFEEKDDGYPVPNFRGTLNLVGGNWTRDYDKSPRGTLVRELGEELVGAKCEYPENAVLFAELTRALLPMGEYHIYASARASGSKEYNFVATLFRANISSFFSSNRKLFAKGIISTETKRPLVTLSQKELEDQAKKRKFCWYDKVLKEYFGKLGFSANIEYFDGVYAAKLDRDPNRPYIDRMKAGEFETFTKNPLFRRMGEQDVFKPQ
jgi:hypothetical protein